MFHRRVSVGQKLTEVGLLPMKNSFFHQPKLTSVGLWPMEALCFLVVTHMHECCHHHWLWQSQATSTISSGHHKSSPPSTSFTAGWTRALPPQQPLWPPTGLVHYLPNPLGRSRPCAQGLVTVGTHKMPISCTNISSKCMK
jgi:hypothetical protein